MGPFYRVVPLSPLQIEQAAGDVGSHWHTKAVLSHTVDDIRQREDDPYSMPVQPDYAITRRNALDWQNDIVAGAQHLTFGALLTRERTRALSDTNAALKETLDRLQATQQSLIEREKLAALGGVVAGVAHEINTPVGVAVTAASLWQQEADGLRAHLAAGALKRSELDAFLEKSAQLGAIVNTNLARAGKIRILAAATGKRIPSLPDVPTTAELGFAGGAQRRHGDADGAELDDSACDCATLDVTVPEAARAASAASKTANFSASVSTT